jgi:50S ribosomal protein L16 3-hydroxylase
LLLRLADGIDCTGSLYRDPRQAATTRPGAMPLQLQAFAQEALARRLADPRSVQRALGEVLTEPKPRVWFERGRRRRAAGLALDPQTRMMYDRRNLFVNGEAFAASRRDAALLQKLADSRRLAPADCARLSSAAQALIGDWLRAGWLHGDKS